MKHPPRLDQFSNSKNTQLHKWHQSISKSVEREISAEATLLTDRNGDHLSRIQRQSMIAHTASLLGNRRLQQNIAVIQRDNTSSRSNWSVGWEMLRENPAEALKELWNSVFGGSNISDVDEMVGNLDDALDKASTSLGVVREFVRDNAQRQQLDGFVKAVKGLRSVTSKFVKTAKAIRTMGKILNLIEAIHDVPDNISANPQGAAEAFGKMFSVAGQLGETLPSGPWTPYCKLLGGAQNFFTDMLRALDPGQRWRRQFDEMDREGSYTNKRGI